MTATRPRLLLLVGLFLASTGLAQAHGGGLDDRGCHFNRDTGRYHCHQGELAGQSFSSEAAAVEALAGDSAGGHSRARTRDDYDRDAYGDWRDLDGDCHDMRDEVLIEHAQSYELGPDGCEIVDGVWLGPYTGERLTDPSDVHIDHVVPLKEAHTSGAAEWSSREKRRFANDEANLLPSEAGANMSKGAQGPADWLPERNRCAYVERWVAVKREYGLSREPAERRAIARVEQGCQ